MVELRNVGELSMSTYKIHPIVMGTKVFDKSMMTYQHGQGVEYTIPIYCWYIEGGDKKILVDTGEMNPIQSKERENAIGGMIYTFEQGLEKYNLKPEDIDIVIHTHLHMDHCENENFDPPPEIKGMEMNVIPPGTHVDVYNAYNIMEDIKEKADILIPVHEPEFASVDTIG
jgi:hypothetical protein